MASGDGKVSKNLFGVKEKGEIKELGGEGEERVEEGNQRKGIENDQQENEM